MNLRLNFPSKPMRQYCELCIECCVCNIPFCPGDAVVEGEENWEDEDEEDEGW